MAMLDFFVLQFDLTTAMAKINGNSNFAGNKILSGEGTVCLNGHVIRHNYRHVSNTIPHYVKQVLT